MVCLKILEHILLQLGKGYKRTLLHIRYSGLHYLGVNESVMHLFHHSMQAEDAFCRGIELLRLGLGCLKFTQNLLCNLFG